MFFDAWLPLERRRRRLLAKTPRGPLHDYLSHPFAARDNSCGASEFLAVDLETTGLDARSDTIVSLGMVSLHGLQIELASAQHHLIRPERAMPERSAVIHQITDDRAAQGEALAEVLAALLRQLAGKVLLAHHARLELAFLDAACERLFGGRFLAPVIDTMAIEQRRRARANRVYRSRELRLDALRQGYNLPRYRAHNALSDAVAAAELFLAQAAQEERGQGAPLKNFLLRC